MSEMTIRVYRKSADGKELDLQPKRAVKLESPEAIDTGRWPPCLCPRHATERQQADSGTTRASVDFG